MIHRLISQNKFTRKQIKQKTGKEDENPIIVVGNAIQRRNVERSILNGKSIAVIGSHNIGKLTSILDICDRHNIDFFMSYDGNGFGDLPYRSKALFIVRYDGYKPIFKKYLKTSQMVFLSTENLSPSLKKLVTHFHYRKLSAYDKKEYERLKGKPFPIKSIPIPMSETLMGNVSTMIHRGITPDKYIPESEKIVAYNFLDKNILQVCIMASYTEDPLFRWGLMNMVRFSRPKMLQYPPRLMKKNDS